MSDTRELLQRALTMIEQVHNLYQQYILRIAKLPPIQEREKLDKLMVDLARAEKSTPTVQFQYQQIQAKYATYKDLWERRLRELETGRRR